MDTTPMEPDPFAVPRPLLAGRKRRATAAASSSSSHFFTPQDFDAFSVRGDVHESRLYGDLETRRRTVVSAIATRTSNAAHATRTEPTHLVQLLVDAIETHQVQAPEKMEELEHARRRLSRFSVAEHEQYLALQRKLIQAQQRGLPGVLALSEDEMTQWRTLEPEVRVEQVTVCRVLARALTAETAKNEAHMPPFAASWYKAMLAQCWNDVYRLYPRFFEPAVVVKLPSAALLGMVESGMPPLNAKEVAARGSCCVVDPQKLAAGQQLKVTGEDNGGLSLDIVSPRQVISADPQAEKLMDQYDCDIAISSSTLVTLFDSDTSVRFADVPSGWGIPMKSRTIVRGGGNSKKQIYLDRPLPGSSTSTREKIAEAGRAALLSRFEAESLVEGSMGGRVTYHIWQLEEKRILVRSTTHAYLTSTDGIATSSSSESSKKYDILSNGEENGKPRLEPGKQKAVPLSVFVMPDYRALGIEEQLTTSERCRFWFHSWLRGGSTVLVARFNPKTNVVDSWETYSPTSLVYGDSSKQSQTLECFECARSVRNSPTTKLHWMSKFFNALSDIPVGNSFIRLKDAVGKGTFGKRRWGVEVLMATTEPKARPSENDTPEAEVMDLHQFMPANSSVGEEPSLANLSQTSNTVLPAWNLPGRIPYTFLSGSYCQSFFLNGLCPSIADGKDCGHVHLRLVASQTASKAKRWHFENYTKVLKKVAFSHSSVVAKPLRVTLSYKFCGESKATPSTASVSNLETRLHCSKPASECLLPHLTLHHLVERVADEQLRKGRSKRRTQKSDNRLRHLENEQ